MTLTVYCKSHKRRPIRFGYLPCFRDVQADIPAGWCQTCGSEVFIRGQTQCNQCRDRRGAILE